MTNRLVMVSTGHDQRSLVATNWSPSTGDPKLQTRDEKGTFTIFHNPKKIDAYSTEKIAMLYHFFLICLTMKKAKILNPRLAWNQNILIQKLNLIRS
jgi:hypothetical protein